MATRNLEIVMEMKDNVSGQLEGLGGKMDKLGATSKRMASIGTAGFAAVTSAVAKSVQTFGKFEQTQVAFESMLGSADEATEMMEDLKTFSAETPFQFKDITNATRTLMSFGSEGEDAKNQIEWLGDIAAGTQVPLGDLSTIFGKVQTKGRAMTEEINQMSERGIPIIDKLAEQFNVGKEEIFEMAEEGELTADVVEKAMISMTEEGGMFENQTKRQADTINGKWSTFKDNIELTAAAFGDLFDEDAKAMLDYLTDATGDLTEFIENNETLVKWTTKGIAAFFGLIGVLGLLGMVLKNVIAFFQSMNVVIGFLNGLTLASLATFGSWIVLLLVAAGAIWKVYDAVFESIKVHNEFYDAVEKERKSAQKLREELGKEWRAGEISDEEFQQGLDRLEEQSKETEKRVHSQIHPFFSALASPHGDFTGPGSLLGDIKALPSWMEEAGLIPFAEGGVVRGPTPALVGEEGPEAIIPLDRLSGGGQQRIVQVYVQGGNYLDRQAADKFAVEIGKRLNLQTRGV